MKYDFKNMKNKASLNQRGWKTLANGNRIPVDSVISTFWFGYQISSIEYQVKSQTFDALKDTVTIYTRHNDVFAYGLKNSEYSVTLDNTTYTITLLQTDSSSLNGVDVLTLSKVS